MHGEEVAVWKRTPEDPIVRLAAVLMLECESLLAGRYADYLCTQGRWAPSWTWVNALAHRSVPELTALAGDDGNSVVNDPVGANQWRRALAFLAEDVLAQIQLSGVTLDQLQRTRLIPLELELSRNPDRCTDPGQFAGLVMAVVRRRPSRRHP
jgi:hypothetical protein